MVKNVLFVLIVGVSVVWMFSGCKRSDYVSNNYVNYHVKQTADDIHALAMDGEQGEMPKGEEDFSR